MRRSIAAMPGLDGSSRDNAGTACDLRFEPATLND